MKVFQPVIALTCVACAIAIPRGARAEAPPNPNDIAQITIASPVVKYLGRTQDEIPKEEITVTARVTFERVTLTTNSGVALLKDRLLQAARKVCAAADPEDVEDDETCIRRAVGGADKQVDSAIARAAGHSGGH